MASFGLLGERLPHSLSPEIHAYFGIDYQLFEVEPSKVESFVKKRSLKGFNVTVPYKQTVIPFLDEIDAQAKEIGAVNTVVNQSGKLVGYNTDVDGMLYAITHSGLNLTNKTVAILGSGGTSKTAEFVAKKLGAKRIYKVGRNSEINYSNLYTQGKTEIIINTTPVGMYPNIDDCVCDLKQIEGLEGVFDAVYNPLITKLTQEARSLGKIGVNGFRMLVEQARKAKNLFFDNDDEKQCKTEMILNELYKKRVNVVLIGMPSSGKTTIGKAVAESLNRRFIDLDAYICEKYSQSVEEIFAEGGERLFREREAECCQEIAKLQGVVIACGGGTICFENNAKRLALNGRMIYIERDIEKLCSSGRPLSEKYGVQKLFEQRKADYEKWGEFTVENIDVQKSVKEIINIYEKNFGY